MPRPGSPAASPSSPSPDGPPGPPGPPERLRLMATALDAAIADSPPAGPVVLYLREPPPGDPGGGDDAEVGWVELDGHDPVDALLGFVAPSAWRALGLCCTGRAATLGGDDRPERAQRAQVVVFFDRQGHSTSVLRRRGVPEVLDEAPVGVLGDCLRRALGLATDPPPATSAPFWVTRWVEAVVASLLDGAGGVAGRLDRRGWPAVAGLHPAAASLPAHHALEPARLAAATAELAGDWPWPRLRTAGPPPVPSPSSSSESGPCPWPWPPPGVAAWMDDGMFARWFAGDLPDLLDTCHHLLAPEAWACLHATVTAVDAREAATGAGAEEGGR